MQQKNSVFCVGVIFLLAGFGLASQTQPASAQTSVPGLVHLYIGQWERERRGGRR